MEEESECSTEEEACEDLEYDEIILEESKPDPFLEAPPNSNGVWESFLDSLLKSTAKIRTYPRNLLFANPKAICDECQRPAKDTGGDCHLRQCRANCRRLLCHSCFGPSHQWLRTTCKSCFEDLSDSDRIDVVREHSCSSDGESDYEEDTNVPNEWFDCPCCREYTHYDWKSRCSNCKRIVCHLPQCLKRKGDEIKLCAFCDLETSAQGGDVPLSLS